jgi:sugar phosphate isomerase/epimerase
MPVAAAAVAGAADAAQRAGISIALEAAPGLWMQKPEDAVRVAMRVNRAHVGVAASLSDFAADDAATLTQRLRLVEPRLLAVRVGSSSVLRGEARSGQSAVWRALTGAGYSGLVIVNDADGS